MEYPKSSQLLSIDFATKIRWRMGHQHEAIFVTLQDKLKVRDYAHKHNVRTSPLLWQTDQPEAIPFGDLPHNYMIKANHGWGWNILCYESKFYRFGNGKELVNEDDTLINPEAANKLAMTRAEVVEQCQQWLFSKHSQQEWAYQQIPPKIIVEALLLTEDGRIPMDYRLYTFNGHVQAINVGSPKYRLRTENAFFTPSWNLFPLSKYHEQLPEPLPAQPSSLSAMLEAAQRLAKGLDFARMDFYETASGPVLGEITIYPDAGGSQTPTACQAFNQWLGKQWKLKPSESIHLYAWQSAKRLRHNANHLKHWLRQTVRMPHSRQ